jgi:hypothetical protein
VIVARLKEPSFLGVLSTNAWSARTTASNLREATSDSEGNGPGARPGRERGDSRCRQRFGEPPDDLPHWVPHRHDDGKSIGCVIDRRESHDRKLMTGAGTQAEAVPYSG